MQEGDFRSRETPRPGRALSAPPESLTAKLPSSFPTGTVVATEGVSPYDAAGIKLPPGYSSGWSSDAPPSLSPLSPVLPLGCASAFGSGLGAWLRFGWDPGGAGVMRGREQRSAAACA